MDNLKTSAQQEYPVVSCIFTYESRTPHILLSKNTRDFIVYFEYLDNEVK